MGRAHLGEGESEEHRHSTDDEVGEEHAGTGGADGEPAAQEEPGADRPPDREHGLVPGRELPGEPLLAPDAGGVAEVGHAS